MSSPSRQDSYDAAVGNGTERGKEPPKLDLSQFDSLEDALDQIDPGDRYVEVGKVLVPLTNSGMPLTIPVAFWFSMISRTQGLHEAVAREIRQKNPYAVFPLLRALVEAVALVNYVVDHPAYVDVLTSRPRERKAGGQKRKSIQSLIDYMKEEAPGLKTVYAELSEATHFGAVAMWTPHAISEADEESLRTTWSSHPRWRSEEEGLIACAQLLELSDAMVFLLEEFTRRHVLPLAVAADSPRRFSNG